ncbi:unnamed protein product [marine sediment metagenome]|uniref:Uncharacterized protein n=1 Tax=marine sediment metagenome TaxID=412755 RepID=X0X0Z7_9ZZZZ
MEKETRNRYITAAYTSWLQGLGGKKTFGEYLNKLGLSEKAVKMTHSQEIRLAKKGFKTAQRILKMNIKKSKK